jgi:hypothetical protein
MSTSRYRNPFIAEVYVGTEPISAARMNEMSMIVNELVSAVNAMGVHLPQVSARGYTYYDVTQQADFNEPRTPAGYAVWTSPNKQEF